MRTRLIKIIEASKPRLISLGLAVIFNVTLAGLVCGTFAWYSYATRASIKDPFKGTTVANMGELQVGLVCNTRLNDCRRYGLLPHNSEEAPISNGKFLYWASTDTLSAEAINYVVSKNGYATTTIEPTTTGSDSALSTYGFHLYQKPTVNKNYQISSSFYAPQSSFVSIPFVFRVGGSGEIEEDPDYGNVFLTNCTLYTSNDAFDDGELHKAVRFYVKNKRNAVVVAPSYDEDGTNDVGGILDLDLNGYYDYDEITNKEIVYGECEEESVGYFDEPTAQNGTVSRQDITSFYSNHKQGVYAVNESTLRPKTVSYYSLSHLTSREYPVAVSDQYYEGFSYGEFLIYLEGWDKHVIDQEQNSAFNLSLSFSL